ncbi:MAG: allophanate hydrolase [Bryobacteraceae bacterium]
MSFSLDLPFLRGAYVAGTLSPRMVVDEVYRRIDQRGKRPVWIELVDRAAALQRAAELEARGPQASLPLYGIPFAVKDNIDVAGMPTTAGCPAFASVPEETAFVVRRLVEAGAILIGKTNLDQFATGLVGVRTPYGVCTSVFDDRYPAGGSSSGSAVAVAGGLVSFALGTDTAGSGRVPAAFNHIIGMKPSRGLLSTSGVLPACRSLDCVSIFALTAPDARTVFDVAIGFDFADPYSREADALRPVAWPDQGFRVGVPAKEQLEFFGNKESEAAYESAVAKLEKLGGVRVEIGFEPFRQAADLLYSGPWVAERLAAIEPFLEAHAAAMNPVVAGIISGGRRYSAADAFRAAYRLRELQRATEAEWRKMDVLCLPTTGTIFTLAEIEAEPVLRNTDLGYYTNFVNLLDLSAVAVPAGLRLAGGLPFSVSLIAPAFGDHALLGLAERLHQGAAARDECPAGFVRVGVLGAHLTGQPLNWQLTSRGGWLSETTRTAPDYRFYALPGTTPPKPGLVREPGFDGPGIELEIWMLPASQYGSFVAAIPTPLGIGTVKLAAGGTVQCFLCEGHAVVGAREITHFGGWRRFLASL